MSHTIRLIGPWNVRFLQDGNERVEVFRVPGEFSLLEDRSNVSFARAFNRPTGLDEKSTVGICVEGDFEDEFLLELNGHPVSKSGNRDGPFPILHLLERSNQVVIKVNSLSAKSIRLDLVQLVIGESDQ